MEDRLNGVLVMGLALCLFAAPVAAHEEKLEDFEGPWKGPAYRAVNGGTAALGEFASRGVRLLSWLPLGEFGSNVFSGNDCWGYTSPSGREYAIMGVSHGTGFVEITTPDNAQLVAMMPGPISTWRDIKVFQNYAYAVSEGGSGIQVYDLSQIDAGTVMAVSVVTSGPGTTRTHNVAIDEDSGFLYRLGGGSPDWGLRIYDLSDPANPTFVSQWNQRYVHDAQIVTYQGGPYDGRQVAFCGTSTSSGGGSVRIHIVDVTDKNNMVTLGIADPSNPQFSHPASFVHQVWLSEDRQFLYMNDEIDEGVFGTPTTTRIFDVSDLSNPVQVSTFSNGNTSRDHNLYTRDGLIYAANYRSGLRIFSTNRDPIFPAEIAFFDTYPADDNANFNGLWSVYPFFPSGTIIGSDIERGLFVWTTAPLPVITPTIAPFPHDRRKNRYLSFNGANPGNRVAFQVELTDVQLGSCDGNGARCRVDRGNDDCGVCSGAGNPCVNSVGCAVGETCDATGDICVNDLFGSIGKTWWVGPPDVNGVSRLVSETYQFFNNSWPDVIHVGDCEVVPRATYAVRAFDETALSDPLMVDTIARPGALYWGDAVGPFNSFCDGNPSKAICGHAGDPPCAGGEMCLGAWPPPDGAVNFDDVGAELRLFQSIEGQVLPDITWVDIHGNNGGDAHTAPPNFVVNFADIQFTILAFQGEPYPFRDPSMCPDDAP